MTTDTHMSKLWVQYDAMHQHVVIYLCCYHWSVLNNNSNICLSIILSDFVGSFMFLAPGNSQHSINKCSMHNRKCLRFLAQIGYFYAVLAIQITQILRDWIKTNYRGKWFSCFCMRTASTPTTHWCAQMRIYIFLEASTYNRPPCPLFIPLRARAFWSSTESMSKSFSRLSLRWMQKEESIKVRFTNKMQKQNEKCSADDSQKTHTFPLPALDF